jgi:hypothetical protein
MKQITRRAFLNTTGAIAGLGILSASTKKTDIRMQDMSSSYEDYLYRAPIKFGGTVVDRATLLNVNCTVRTSNGKVGKGFGSMPLGNVWAFPSKKMPYDTTLAAMKALAQEIIKITAAYKEPSHPIDINWASSLCISKLPPISRSDCISPSPFQNSAPWLPPARSMPPSTMPTARCMGSTATIPMARSS